MADYEKMLDEILNDESDAMTAWEVEFVESLDRQRNIKQGTRTSWEPSPKQKDVLDKIWGKVFG